MTETISSAQKRRAAFYGLMVFLIGGIAATIWHFRYIVMIVGERRLGAVWIGILLGTALLAIVPFAMAAYGGHVAAESIADPKQRRKVKLKFWAICIFGVALAFVQQYRAITSDAAARTKTEHVEGAILGQLQSLHEQGHPLTPEQAEIKRRADIMTLLRGQYILTHGNITSGILDGTESLPAQWLNQKLHDMGETWTVAEEEPRRGTVIIPRSYLTFDGCPRFTGISGGQTEGANFKAGEEIGFNIHYKAAGPDPITIVDSATESFIAPDFKLETQEKLVANFVKQVNQERKTLPRPQSNSTMMPGDVRFLTAFAYTEANQRLTLTQDDLDKLRAGARIAFVIAEVTYRDKSVTHHLRRCKWLQPPASPPGVWHFCAVFTNSD